jgi:hypothetical protein
VSLEVKVLGALACLYGAMVFMIALSKLGTWRWVNKNNSTRHN